MDIQKIHQYKSAFDAIAKEIKDDEGNAIEVWYARELQQVLGYARWENFVVAVGRAMEACKTMGINVDDHFREVTKMITLAKGAQREVQDFMLTRFTCYLIAQNGEWPKTRRVCRKTSRDFLKGTRSSPFGYFEQSGKTGHVKKLRTRKHEERRNTCSIQKL